MHVFRVPSPHKVLQSNMFQVRGSEGLVQRILLEGAEGNQIIMEPQKFSFSCSAKIGKIHLENEKWSSKISQDIENSGVQKNLWKIPSTMSSFKSIALFYCSTEIDEEGTKFFLCLWTILGESFPKRCRVIASLSSEPLACCPMSRRRHFCRYQAKSRKKCCLLLLPPGAPKVAA